MNDLHQRIQGYLHLCSVRHSASSMNAWALTDRKSLTKQLQKLYSFSTKADRGDNLVPYNVCTLENIPVQYSRTRKKYNIRYRWNTELNSEFLGKPERIAGEIPIGTILDRIGDKTGQYMSPVHGDNIYSASERAIPYFFLEKSLPEEPSYHSYTVVKAISEHAIRNAIQCAPIFDDGSGFCFENEIIREDKLNEVNYKGILFGAVAPVRAFGSQGIGNGQQYRFPISVGYLLKFGFIVERC